jgi:hypothetical protein
MIAPDVQWKNGMVEKWNVGDEKRMWSNFIFGVNANSINLDFIPPNPVFQHSNIPSFHGIDLRHSQFYLTWSREPSFQC